MLHPRPIGPIILEMENSVIPAFDLNNPRSLASIVTPTFRELMLNLPAEYLGHDEADYIKTVGQNNITGTDKSIRMAFWLEYERAQSKQVRMELTRCYEGCASDDYFYKMIKNPRRLGFLLIPPKGYVIACKTALYYATVALQKIVDDFLAADKRDAKMADTVMKVFKILDDRINGAVVQRVDQRNVNVNMNQSAGELETSASMEELQKKLDNLRSKVTPKAIEVISEPDAG